jgi:hypothetical protein
MGGFLLELTTFAVTVMLWPKLMLLDDSLWLMAVGLTTVTLVALLVEGA